MFAESDERLKKLCDDWVRLMQIINLEQAHLEFKFIRTRVRKHFCAHIHVVN